MRTSTSSGCKVMMLLPTRTSTPWSFCSFLRRTLASMLATDSRSFGNSFPCFLPSRSARSRISWFTSSSFCGVKTNSLTLSSSLIRSLKLCNLSSIVFSATIVVMLRGCRNFIPALLRAERPRLQTLMARSIAAISSRSIREVSATGQSL